jgi:hypothetical protein
LITQTILGEEYKSLIHTLCSFLHSPVTLSLLGPNILLNRPKYSPQHHILKNPQPTCDPPSLSVTKFHTHKKQKEKL